MVMPWLPVRWNPVVSEHRRRYPVLLRIEVLDRVGILKDILTRLSDSSINVLSLIHISEPTRPY